MKFKIYTLLAFFSILGLTACSDFEKKNIDPYNPPYNPGESNDVNPDGIDLDYEISEAELKQLKNSESSIGSLFRNLTYEGLYNDYQVTTNLTHDIYAGYMANASAGFHESSPTYVYTDKWSKRRWEHFYDDRTAQEYAQLVKIFHFVNPEKYKNEFYVTRIYYAFLISMQTDTYGDIPLSYYVKGALPPDQNVSYDSQEKVYDIMFALLDQAIQNIEPSKGLNFGQSTKGKTNDKCFDQDINKWLRFANTLRLRLALRISNINPGKAQEQGVAALTNAHGLMQSNEDNMRTVPKFASIADGGEDDGGSENIHALIFSWGAGMLMSKDMEIAYKTQSSVLDPRCERLWWRPSPFEDLTKQIESDKDYAGCPIGNPDILGSKSTEQYSTIRASISKDKTLNPDCWFSFSRELVWLGYAESCFLKAEAALRGWQGAGSVRGNYLAGIQASLAYFQIDASKANAYIDGLKNDPFAGSNKEAQLEQIITQKWLAMFPNGNEGWAEFRRTDYPRLLNIEENNSDGDVAEGKFIKRIKYPDSESMNPNRPSDYQGIRVWWDVADTNNDKGERNTANNFRNGIVSMLFR